MSKKFRAVSKVSSVAASVRRTFKVFAVSFHGPELEQIQNELSKQIASVGLSKKILEVTISDAVGVQTLATDSKKTLDIEKGVEKCRKSFDAVWKTQKINLKDDLKSYWDSHANTTNVKEIIPKMLKDKDMSVLVEELENADMWMCDFFIILFGKFTPDVLNGLILKNISLQAIIHFIPCPVADLKIDFPELYVDIDFLKKSPVTKSVGIFTESLMPGTKYSGELYQQFTWYLYDIEMLAQQFTMYQTEFVEINDSSQDKISRSVQLLSRTNISTIQDTEVEQYLDNLSKAIEKRTVRNTDTSIMYLRPFLRNDHDKIIVEEGNQLLQTALATQMDMPTYWRLIDVIVNTFEDCPTCSKDVLSKIQLPPYYELLSWQAFAQKLRAKRIYYDICRCADLTDTSKLYIYKRTLNKIVEVTRKLRLPTKLCFRDFCEYLAPGLPAVLKNYKLELKEAQQNQIQAQDIDEDDEALPNKIPPKFCGLSFDNTLQELEVKTKIFRFKDGSITCNLENWLNEKQKLEIIIRLFHTTIYTHRGDGYFSRQPRVRVVTTNDIACDIEFVDDLESTSVNLSVLWPNDCEIRYLNEDGIQAVEQRYNWKRNVELKRLFTRHGCVITYLIDDIIEVLTPNGIIYRLYSNDYIDEEISSDLKYYCPVRQVNITDELAFVRSLHSYGIDCEHFDVTRSDGRKLRVLNGCILEEKQHFMTFEWIDCQDKEWCAERDDGVKMIWTIESFRCFYPCGTVITSTTVEDEINMSFGCRSKSTELILKKINPSLVEKVANKAERHDTFVTYNINYLMQHKNYASVAFCGDEYMEIHSPDKMKVCLKDHNLVLIDMADTLSLRINARECAAFSENRVPDERKIYLKINFDYDVNDVVQFHDKYSSVSLYANGEMTLLEKIKGLLPCHETLYFMSEQNEFGMAFFAEEQFRVITTSFKEKTYCYDTATNSVLFKPILLIDQQFSMPIPGLEKCLSKFKPVCQKEPKEKLVLERMLNAKVIHKLETIPRDIRILTKTINFTEATLEEQLTEALEFFLIPKFKPRISIEWKRKNRMLKEDLEIRNYTKRVFATMLYQNICPKYHEFKKYKGDIKKLALKEYSYLNTS